MIRSRNSFTRIQPVVVLVRVYVSSTFYDSIKHVLADFSFAGTRLASDATYCLYCTAGKVTNRVYRSIIGIVLYVLYTLVSRIKTTSIADRIKERTVLNAIPY